MTLLYIKLGLGLALLIIAGSFYAGAKYARKLDAVKADLKQTVADVKKEL